MGYSPFTTLCTLGGHAKFAFVGMENINRRESPRMEIRLRCHVTSPAGWNRSSIFTQDISRNGVRIAWRSDGAVTPRPFPGQLITLEIELPANHGFGQKCIHCQGMVVRVSGTDEESTNVALRLNYMDFRSFNDRIRSFESLNPALNCWTA